MTVKKRLSPIDLLFLAAESRESMMHVGAMMQFTPPPDASPTFLHDLMEEIRHDASAVPPWNLKLRTPGVLTSPNQAWIEDPTFDVEYHVRHSALPMPGGERELGVLVSRLHGNPIDFHRPPWEVHFIEGLPHGRFAIYVKVHHSLVDGYTGMKLLARSLSTDPAERDTPIFFARGAARARTSDGPSAPPTLAGIVQRASDELEGIRAAMRAAASVARAKGLGDSDLIAPLRAPCSVINAPISRNRRFATQQFEVERMRHVARAFDATLNDLVLALCASALRRLLLEQGSLPPEAMTAMLPVNIRPKDDPGGGNAVGAIYATLATDVEDPEARLRTIVASTRRAKDELVGLGQNAILEFSAMMLAPMVFSMAPGAAGRVRPAFNLVISNVPGPAEKLYFRGYELDAYYPLSVPIHGYGLNITVVTYGTTLNFGFTGDRDSLRHLQRLSVYAREALIELESAILRRPG